MVWSTLNFIILVNFCIFCRIYNILYLQGTVLWYSTRYCTVPVREYGYEWSVHIENTVQQCSAQCTQWRRRENCSTDKFSLAPGPGTVPVMMMGLPGSTEWDCMGRGTLSRVSTYPYIYILYSRLRYELWKLEIKDPPAKAAPHQYQSVVSVLITL